MEPKSTNFGWIWKNILLVWVWVKQKSCTVGVKKKLKYLFFQLIKKSGRMEAGPSTLVTAVCGRIFVFWKKKCTLVFFWHRLFLMTKSIYKVERPKSWPNIYDNLVLNFFLAIRMYKIYDKHFLNTQKMFNGHKNNFFLNMSIFSFAGSKDNFFF